LFHFSGSDLLSLCFVSNPSGFVVSIAAVGRANILCTRPASTVFADVSPDDTGAVVTSRFGVINFVVVKNSLAARSFCPAVSRLRHI
jgi:hypothetical protein